MSVCVVGSGGRGGASVDMGGGGGEGGRRGKPRKICRLCVIEISCQFNVAGDFPHGVAASMVSTVQYHWRELPQVSFLS